MRTSLATLLALAAFSGAAAAATYSAGPAYGGPNAVGGTLTCRVFNSGAAAVSIASRQLFDNKGNPQTLTGDSCAASLPVNHECDYAATISADMTLTCKLTTSGADTSVSGVAEIFKGGAVLLSLPLQKNVP